MIRSRLMFVAAATLLLSRTAAAQSAAQPFTFNDLVRLDRVAAMSIDSSERYLAFQVRTLNAEETRGVQSLFIRDLSTQGVERKLAISTGGAFSPQWGRGGALYFLSARSGSTQLWKTDAAGATATQVTRLPLDVGSYKLSPDGRGVVVSLAVFPSCKGVIACTVRTDSVNKAQKSSGVIYDKLFVRHWDTYADGTRNHLFYVPFAGGAPVALTSEVDGDVPSKPYGDESEYSFSPDGKSVYYSVRIAGRDESRSTNFDIYRVDIATPAQQVNLTAGNKAWDTGARVSPDGKWMAYRAMKRPGFEADRFGVYLRNLATGAVTPLAERWDHSADALEWAPDGESLYLTAQDTGRVALYRLPVDAAQPTRISRDGHIDAFVPLASRMLFMKSSMVQPSQIYLSRPQATLVDDGALALTQVNASKLASRRFGSYEQFSFAGWNNEKVFGYVVKPSGYVEGRKYPVAFLVHGGPQGSFGDAWSYRWNPQTYAGAGFAVVMIDFHGSTGYGQAFTDAISQHWGDRPLEDLQKGYAHALSRYAFLDSSRACALGASYGGYMMNWMASQWKQPWKCIVNHDGLFDTRSMGYATDELWFSEWENGGSVFDVPKNYDQFNPALHVNQWSVPMLVIHSDLDYRVLPEQGLGTFTALQSKGIESKMLRFPDENHWVLKPQNSLLWHRTVFDWLQQHTAGAGRPAQP
jgi:acylaminoacyl-peptidase